jgi:hypothetical protein
MVLYWFETSTFMINNTSVQKQVKISLIMFPDTRQNLTKEQGQLQQIATAISQQWEPIKTWAQAAFAISQNGLTLALFFTTLLITVILYHTYLLRQENQSRKRLYGKLPSAEKLFLQSITQASKTETPEMSTIAASFHNLTGEDISLPSLAEKLSEAEKSGLVKKSVINREDVPAIVWIPQINFAKLD